MLATSTDGMLTWQKHPVPVIPEPPYPGTPAHHDAQIWKDGDTWYQLVGGSYEGNGAAVLHSSKDLLQWSYAGRIFTGEDGKHGVFWELPYLLPYGRKDVMIIGIHPVPYFVGSYDKERREFTPEREGVLDYGTKIYYAPNPHMVDDKGEGGSERRIMIGWIREVEGSPAPGSGWNGMFSIPRIVTLLPDDNLAFDPAPELEVLRRDHRRFEEVPLDGTSTGMLEGRPRGQPGDPGGVPGGRRRQRSLGAEAPLLAGRRRGDAPVLRPDQREAGAGSPEVEPTPGPGPAAARGAVGPGPGRDADSQGLPGPLGDRGVRQQDGLHHRADISVPVRQPGSGRLRGQRRRQAEVPGHLADGLDLVVF